MAGNIIPAIATTNAMTGGLTVLAAFKVLKGDMTKTKKVFLSHSLERVIDVDSNPPPNPNCDVCSLAQALVRVDLKRATLQDLVDIILKEELGYGEEFTVFSDSGALLFDVDEDVNLPKKLAEIGVDDASFLTVVDEADEPRISLKLAILAEELPEDQKPVALDKKPDLPPKPKKLEPTITNGVSTNGENGTSNGTKPDLKRKRDAAEADIENDPVRKKGKVPEQPNDDDIVFIDGPSGGDGAIVIDDD